ncbi:hypothetical protein I79_017061 [Cricetulus griseus]|uniref:Uncharacterized protein n=1 Tax=Cricetulus griseus TaxID=10029 RepID=G3I118_CRIGR|nr:hypothetical protein I79_017061 [Cricetulus griseus]
MGPGWREEHTLQHPVSTERRTGSITALLFLSPDLNFKAGVWDLVTVSCFHSVLKWRDFHHPVSLFWFKL